MLSFICLSLGLSCIFSLYLRFCGPFVPFMYLVAVILSFVCLSIVFFACGSEFVHFVIQYYLVYLSYLVICRRVFCRIFNIVNILIQALLWYLFVPYERIRYFYVGLQVRNDYCDKDKFET